MGKGDGVAPPAMAYGVVAEIVGEKWFLTPMAEEGTILKVACQGDGKTTTWYMDNGMARLVAERLAGNRDVSVVTSTFTKRSGR